MWRPGIGTILDADDEHTGIYYVIVCKVVYLHHGDVTTGQLFALNICSPRINPSISLP